MCLSRLAKSGLTTCVWTAQLTKLFVTRLVDRIGRSTCRMPVLVVPVVLVRVRRNRPVSSCRLELLLTLVVKEDRRLIMDREGSTKLS
jgi:hypothetical protein